MAKPKKTKKQEVDRIEVALIEWEDAWSQTDDVYNKEAMLRSPKCVRLDVGFVIQDDKHGMAIAQFFMPDGRAKPFRNVLFVPRPLIRSISWLKSVIVED